MNNRYKEIIRIILLVLWMGVIFFMSEQDGTHSSGQSNFIAEILKNIGFDITAVLGDSGTFIIRKLGHLTEYFILAILFFRVFVLKFKMYTVRVISIITTFIYACSDEFHQSFIVGRTASFRDVLIDTFGGILAMLLLYLIYHIKNRVKDMHNISN